MRAFSLSLAAVLAAVPCWASAEQADAPAPKPAQTEQPKVTKDGMPIPPTKDEVAALEPELRLQHSTGIKHVLLLLHARNREERYRLTPQTLAACAGLAREWECPAAVVENLQRRSEGNMSPRQRYEWEQAFRKTLAAYCVDTLMIRLLVEQFPCSSEQWLERAKALPMEVLFNGIATLPDNTEQVMEDLRLMAQVMQESANIYASIQDAESAKAAIPPLCELLKLHERTQAVRFAMAEKMVLPLSEAQQAEMEALLNAAHAACVAQRQRLSEKSFFGDEMIPILDYLLH